MQQTPYALIWDLDGVLVDSAEYHYRSWRETMQTLHNHDMSLSDFRRTFGLRNTDFLRDVLGLQLTSAEVDHLADMKEARYREMVRFDGLQLIRGASTWLESAQRAGWLQA